MKISKLFHTLYGCLMALPVLVIPIFAININQKSVEPISIVVKEKQQVEFNQQIYNGNFLNVGNWTITGGATYTVSDNVATMDSTSQNNVMYQKNTLVNGHQYYVTVTIKMDNFTVGAVKAYQVYNGNSWVVQEINNSDWKQYNTIFTATATIVQPDGFRIAQDNRINNFSDIYIKDVMFIDISLIYGVGNEPSIAEFLENFPNEYYPYTVSSYVDMDVDVTYDNTDIGSQFLYSIYKPVNDYFNFKYFMGLGSLYDWILLNIFSGSNNLVFFILFNFFTYWIFVSFFWLIFDVLMYVPSLVHKMLDKARME